MGAQEFGLLYIASDAWALLELLSITFSLKGANLTVVHENIHGPLIGE